MLTLVARRITTIKTRELNKHQQPLRVRYFNFLRLMKNIPTRNGFPSPDSKQLHLHRTHFNGRRQIMAVMWVSRVATNNLRSLISSEHFFFSLLILSRQ